MNSKQHSKSDNTFHFILIILFSLVSFSFVYPFIYVIVNSFSTPESAAMGGFKFWPTKVSCESYKSILSSVYIWKGYGNTIYVTAMHWCVSMILTVAGGYALSKKYFPNRNFWTMVIVFTMFFDGGLIPNYLLINNTLHMRDTFWALIIPKAVLAWYLLIVRNFFMSLPEELEEAATIDGASPFSVLVRIILPISMPILATVSLWIIVNKWNEWYDCMLYITDKNKYVLQIVLRRIIFEDSREMNGTIESGVGTIDTSLLSDSLTRKSAAIMVTTLPILMIYPFIQKHFVKGIMVGSIKG